VGVNHAIYRKEGLRAGSGEATHFIAGGFIQD
jgi:hypothetical protein